MLQQARIAHVDVWRPYRPERRTTEGTQQWYGSRPGRSSWRLTSSAGRARPRWPTLRCASVERGVHATFATLGELLAGTFSALHDDVAASLLSLVRFTAEARGGQPETWCCDASLNCSMHSPGVVEYSVAVAERHPIGHGPAGEPLRGPDGVRLGGSSGTPSESLRSHWTCGSAWSG